MSTFLDFQWLLSSPSIDSFSLCSIYICSLQFASEILQVTLITYNCSKPAIPTCTNPWSYYINTHCEGSYEKLWKPCLHLFKCDVLNYIIELNVPLNSCIAAFSYIILIAVLSIMNDTFKTGIVQVLFYIAKPRLLYTKTTSSGNEEERSEGSICCTGPWL